MKRLLALFFALVLVCCTAASSFSEDVSFPVYSYDFDLRFHMNADVFPARDRTRMQGYADLLNMIGLKGNLTFCPSNESFDLNAEIIPITNPDASISFRLYGTPKYVGLSSPLLGNETAWFQNPFLMEFAFKTWNNLRIPLQYPALLHPYVTEAAFQQMAKAWNSRFGSVRKSTTFSRKKITALSEQWASVLHNDSSLKYWIYAISLPSKNGDIMETEFSRLPDYVLNRVFPKGGLKYILKGSTETWANEQGETLFTRTSENGCSEWALTLPATENGYLPRLSVRSGTDSASRLYSLSLKGSYNLPESRETGHSALPDSLFSISLDMNNWPADWPMDASFNASLDIGGVLYPNVIMTLCGTGSADGSLSLTLSEPVEGNGTSVDVFSCSGTFIPVVSSVVPEYTRKDFLSFLSIFNVSDQSKDDFIHSVRRPLFLGVLNFLDELPSSACQSVMDDLEEYGLLDIVLID